MVKRWMELRRGKDNVVARNKREAKRYRELLAQVGGLLRGKVTPRIEQGLVVVDVEQQKVAQLPKVRTTPHDEIVHCTGKIWGQ